MCGMVTKMVLCIHSFFYEWMWIEANVMGDTSKWPIENYYNDTPDWIKFGMPFLSLMYMYVEPNDSWTMNFVIECSVSLTRRNLMRRYKRDATISNASGEKVKQMWRGVWSGRARYGRVIKWMGDCERRRKREKEKKKEIHRTRK